LVDGQEANIQQEEVARKAADKMKDVAKFNVNIHLLGEDTSCVSFD
jgi:hypothetical protein